MTKLRQMLPAVAKTKTDDIVNSLICFFKEKWRYESYEKLKSGYSDMSQINLALAEIGLEEDMMDLCMYEFKLGCEESDS